MSHRATTFILGMAFTLSHSAFALPPRLPGQTVRLTLEGTGDGPEWQQSDGWVVASIPTGGWCRPDGADLQIQDAAGRVFPLEVISSNPEGSTLIQFKGNGEDRQYWVSMGNASLASAAKATSGRIPTVEVRPFTSDRFETWAEALKELTEQPQIQGNALIAGLRGSGNPFRNARPANFAAVYRGNLKIESAGTYRFSASADDASFLFLNRQLIFQQTGKRQAPRNVEEWHEIELKPGLLPFEYFHISGSTAEKGSAALAWKPPGKPKWEVIPPAQYLSAPVAEVRSVDGFDAPAALFVYGVEDALVSPGASAYLTRFQAHGNFANPAQLRWDFGDGSMGSGDSVQHVYLEPGEYLVTLQAGNLPPFRQRIYVDEPPVNSGPGALKEALDVLAQTRWQTTEPARVNKIFNFVIASQQPGRWKVQAALAQNLLGQQEIDGPRKATLYAALLEAMAEEGQAAEAIKLKEKMLTDLGRSASLRFRAMQTLAHIQWKYLRNFKEASQLYEQLVEENRRAKRPELRKAVIEWGDMFLESGDMNQAQERYRLASTLGGDSFAATGQVKAIERGALLRVAEQRLRAGNIRESRALLNRLELEHPEQKLEGLFRLLRAEVDYKDGRYTEAIRNYEVLLKLSQWASYRDKALNGIAQSYYRLGDLKKARELFEGIKNSYPEYYDGAKLPALVARIDERLARKDPAAVFCGFKTGFDRDDQETVKLTHFAIEEGLGISGRGVASVIPPPQRGESIYAPTLTQELDDLEPGGQYWVEIWYREQPAGVLQRFRPEITATLAIRGEQIRSEASQKLTLDRTFGQWRKVGFLLRAPEGHHADLQIRMHGITGSCQWDGLRVVPVSDWEVETLNNFIQGDHATNE